MLSTLRPRTMHGRQLARLIFQDNFQASRQSVSCSMPVLRRAPHKLTVSGRTSVRFCSDGSKKPPPKGFEKFFQGRDAQKVETKTSEASSGKKGPSETPGKQENGKGTAETKSSEKGPGEKKSGEKTSGEKTSEKKSSEGGQKGPGQLPGQLTRQQMMLGGGAAAFVLYTYLQRDPEQPEVTIQEMTRDYLMKGYVEKIQIVNKAFCRVHLRGDAPGTNAGKILTIQLGTPEAFEARIEHLQTELGLSPVDHVPIQYVNEMDLMAELMPHLPSLLLIIPLLLGLRAMASGMGGPGTGPGGAGGRNMFSIGKAFPAGQKDLKSKVKFADVAGLEQAKKEVVEFVDFLKNPTKYEQLGARVPKGGLLVGPPGTGKTLLAKAIAGEAECPFYSMSGSDFVEMFVGVGPSRVRDLFQQARASAPSIIFIDEIDAVGRKRSSGGFSGGNDERENTLNAMLVEMDGFSSGTGVVVLAGTNRADILDPALTRPGRFDRQIAIDKPDLTEREQIFKVHLKPVTLNEDLAVESVAHRMAALTPGFAGSDIANICNEAAIFAARRNSPSVDMEDFERATERVLGGLPKTNNLMNAKEKKTIAIHESGHAIAGWFLEYADPLLKVSIVPRSSGALGFAQYLPDEISLFSKEAILDKIAVALGGRAAEELFVGRISTGAADDLDKVTKMAYSMVSVYGMNPEIGLLSYNQNSASEQFYKPYSEETGRVIDREARAIVDAQYQRVKALLTEKGQVLKDLSSRLMEKETLVYNELKEVMGERPYALKKEYQKFVTAGGNPFTIETEPEAKAESKEESKSEVDSAPPGGTPPGPIATPQAQV